MLARSEAAPRAALPTYALYGEHGRTEATDWLHCESIAERSQHHAWEIRPHRHEQLFQILYIARGAVAARLDDRSEVLAGPCVLAVPALLPHGFRFAPEIDGSVITVLERHLVQLLSGAPALAERVMQPLLLRWVDGDDAGAAVATAVRGLRDEFIGTGPWRDLALDAALLRLAVALGRLAPAPAEASRPGLGGARALGHVRRFRALVEAQYRQQPTLAALARPLGITPTQLNRACHQVLGHSALGVLHGRLVLEAQRDLAYTTLSIKQVALGLGFGDAGYFSRFFLRETGQTPSAWRQQAVR
ncbi:MAG: helix-turn-helix domain-containing protein [Burkholderiales bacterium]|nr:helix-turn-helix domain-containing protein [Burkholderiales bacterium]